MTGDILLFCDEYPKSAALILLLGHELPTFELFNTYYNTDYNIETK